MNSVHEQCPNSDSETVLSQKLVKCTVCTHTAQPARQGAHRHAQARTGTPKRAQARPGARSGRVVAAQPAVSQRPARAPARCPARLRPARLGLPYCAPKPRSSSAPAPFLRAPPYAQMGSSPFQCLHHFFFSRFSHPFFFLISF